MQLVSTITPAVQQHTLSDLYVSFMLQNKLHTFSPGFPALKYQELSNDTIVVAMAPAIFTV